MLPGVIDPQVHLREPGLEHKEDLFTASCACAQGGVTSFLEMPNTRPLTTNQAALDDKLRRVAEKCLVNYGFFIGATGENRTDLLEAQPVCGIKIFMGSMHDLENHAPVRWETLKTKCSWSPFEGWELTGWSVVTIVGSQAVYDHGKLNPEVRGQALTFSKA